VVVVVVVVAADIPVTVAEMAVALAIRAKARVADAAAAHRRIVHRAVAAMPVTPVAVRAAASTKWMTIFRSKCN
jgi:hypothetical protein